MRMKVKFVVWVASALALVGVVNADGVVWDDLTDNQKTLLADHENAWGQMDAARQERISTGAARWLDMSRREQGQAQDRFQQWQNLGDAQRGTIRDRYQLYRNLTPDARDLIQDTYQRFQRLPPDRRMELRGQFRSLTPDQLRRLRDTRLRPTDQSGAGTVRGR